MHTNKSATHNAPLSTGSIPVLSLIAYPDNYLINIVYDNYGAVTALDYEIADKNAKVLLHGYWPVNKGRNKTIINLSLLAAGAYRLIIKDKDTEQILVHQQVSRR